MPSNFNSSRLIRLLSELVQVEADASRQDFAQRLSLWVDAFNAVKLHGLHQAFAGAARKGAAGRPASVAALQRDILQVRAGLWQVVDARLQTQDEAGDDYVRHHQCHLDLQRQMESKISALRQQVRQAVSAAAPRLRPLAALDVTFEQMLAAREHKLWATVPALLERRFEQLRAAASVTEPDAAPDGDDARAEPAQGGGSGWLGQFLRDQQAVLRAELQVRLQPVMGLMEAYDNELKTQA